MESDWQLYEWNELYYLVREVSNLSLKEFVDLIYYTLDFIEKINYTEVME